MHASASQGKRIALWAGPMAAFGLIFLYHPDIEHPEIGYTLALAAWMAIWWITEAVPLAITSLLPVAFFPLLGIMDGQTVSAAYFNQYTQHHRHRKIETPFGIYAGHGIAEHVDVEYGHGHDDSPDPDFRSDRD
jgi:di/tricarboxylate transporter